MDAIEIRIIIGEEGLILATHPYTPQQLAERARKDDVEARIALSLFDTIQQWGLRLNSGNDSATQPNG